MVPAVIPSQAGESNMSNLSEILRNKSAKKATKTSSRKNSQLSALPSSAIQKQKAGPLSKQAILELLPTRSRGRPTKADKDLRQALKSKKFNYLQQPETVRTYVDKLMGKKRAGQRRQDRDKRKQSELSHNPDDQSQRGRLLSAGVC